ncbi:hypothetical protein JW877_08565 [bacterium]|nr:hypothetical protein [bacterium]
MRNHRIIQLVFLGLILVSFFSLSCTDESGESYINMPEGPKTVFRGGYGKVVIRYFPPPPPIFKVAQASQYLDFDVIRKDYGIPDKPIVIQYLIQTSVMSPIISQKTANAPFNNYVVSVVQSWIYTRYGTGSLKIKIDVAKKKMWVDADGIKLIDPEPGKPRPTVAPGRQLVASTGFTIYEGKF